MVPLGFIGSGPFSISLNDLELGKLYYARAAATNVVGELVTSSVAVFTPQLYSGGTVRPGNVIGWWKFDETSGATAADSSGNNLDGTVSGSLFQAGKFRPPPPEESSAQASPGLNFFRPRPELFQSWPELFQAAA